MLSIIRKQAWFYACLFAACAGVAPAFSQSENQAANNSLHIFLTENAAPLPGVTPEDAAPASSLQLAQKYAVSQAEYSAQSGYAQQAANRQTTAQQKPQSTARLGIVSRDETRIYRKASSGSPTLFRCGKGTALGLVGQTKKYYAVLMIDRTLGFVSKSNVQLYNSGVVVSPNGGGDMSNRIVQIAMEYIGIPYVWGGTSRSGLDCSGFVKNVFSRMGISLPRVARDQFNVGRPVRWGELAPGDRLYFSAHGVMIDHTGIYIGNGHFIHASGRHDAVVISSITEPRYYRILVGARRS
ncbi:MAG TPA: NlpC/P60 family protein [Armatimonadota bacterium]|nr:NlpC/P60 family protein [Armatimonadota bacterium]